MLELIVELIVKILLCFYFCLSIICFVDYLMDLKKTKDKYLEIKIDYQYLVAENENLKQLLKIIRRENNQ